MIKDLVCIIKNNIVDGDGQSSQAYQPLNLENCEMVTPAVTTVGQQPESSETFGNYIWATNKLYNSLCYILNFIDEEGGFLYHTYESDKGWYQNAAKVYHVHVTYTDIFKFDDWFVKLQVLLFIFISIA